MLSDQAKKILNDQLSACIYPWCHVMVDEKQCNIELNNMTWEEVLIHFAEHGLVGFFDNVGDEIDLPE